MDGRGTSDRPIVPGKPPNKAPERAAEVVEGRGRAKGKPPGCTALRTQSRAGAPSALERLRQAARRDRKQRFTALLHHVYRSEEHTSELQSQSNLVCRLLLEKKKKQRQRHIR